MKFCRSIPRICHLEFSGPILEGLVPLHKFGITHRASTVSISAYALPEVQLHALLDTVAAKALRCEMSHALNTARRQRLGGRASSSEHFSVRPPQSPAPIAESEHRIAALDVDLLEDGIFAISLHTEDGCSATLFLSRLRCAAILDDMAEWL